MVAFEVIDAGESARFGTARVGTVIAPAVVMSLRNVYTVAFLMAFAALASACGSSSPTSPTTSANVTITIQGDRGNQSYSPPSATMTAGQTVAWHNGDSTAHTA